MKSLEAKFHIGQVIRHRLFNYRGVVLDVDAVFQGSEAWYNRMARSRPPKDKPWYRVLVHGAEHETLCGGAQSGAGLVREPDPTPPPDHLLH